MTTRNYKGYLLVESDTGDKTNDFRKASIQVRLPVRDGSSILEKSFRYFAIDNASWAKANRKAKDFVDSLVG